MQDESVLETDISKNIPISVKLGVVAGIFLAVFVFCMFRKTIPDINDIILIIAFSILHCF